MRRTKSANVKRGRHQILDDSQIGGGGRNILDFFYYFGRLFFVFLERGLTFLDASLKGVAKSS